MYSQPFRRVKYNAMLTAGPVINNDPRHFVDFYNIVPYDQQYPFRDVQTGRVIYKQYSIAK
jgi:hypothetical protein